MYNLSEIQSADPKGFLCLKMSTNQLSQPQQFMLFTNVVSTQSLLTCAGFNDEPYSGARRRGQHYPVSANPAPCDPTTTDPQTQWKRLLLLIVAITVHNIPEGLAVGVGNAAIGSSPSATYKSAR